MLGKRGRDFGQPRIGADHHTHGELVVLDRDDDLAGQEQVVVKIPQEDFLVRPTHHAAAIDQRSHIRQSVRAVSDKADTDRDAVRHGPSVTRSRNMSSLGIPSLIAESSAWGEPML
jgi:hypothetical protein